MNSEARKRLARTLGRFTMATALAPRYKHDDNDCCTFLGYFGDEDLYVCAGFGTGTYIARSSDEEGDYESGAIFVGVSDAITHAHNLATEQGIALARVGDALRYGADDDFPFSDDESVSEQSFQEAWKELFGKDEDVPAPDQD